MKLLENFKKILKKTNTSEINRGEERIAAENRLTEYLSEEQKRKKILEEKLSDELQIKKRDQKQRDKKRRFDELIAIRKIQHEQNRDEQERIQEKIEEQRRLEESEIVMQRVEQNRLGKIKTEELCIIEEQKPKLDTQFVNQNEVNVTNIGSERLRYDKFPGKIGYVPKKGK